MLPEVSPEDEWRAGGGRSTGSSCATEGTNGLWGHPAHVHYPLDGGRAGSSLHRRNQLIKAGALQGLGDPSQSHGVNGLHGEQRGQRSRGRTLG